MDETKRGSLNFSRIFTSTIQKVKEGASDFDNLPPLEGKGTSAGEKVKSVKDLESRQKWTSGDGSRPRSEQNSGEDPKLSTKRSTCSGEDSRLRTKRSSGEDPKLRTKPSSGEDSQSRTKCSGQHSQSRTKPSSGEDSQSRTKRNSGEDPKLRTKRNSGEDSRSRRKGRIGGRSRQTSGAYLCTKSGPGSREQLSGLPAPQDTDLPLNSEQSPTEGKDKCSAKLDSSKSTPVVQHLDVPNEKLVGHSSATLPEVSLIPDCSANQLACAKPEKDCVSKRKSVVRGKGNGGRQFVRKPVSRGRGYSQRYAKRIDGVPELAQPGVTIVENTSDNIIDCSKVSKPSKSEAELNTVSKSSSDFPLGESDKTDQGCEKYLSECDLLRDVSAASGTDGTCKKNSVDREQVEKPFQDKSDVILRDSVVERELVNSASSKDGIFVSSSRSSGNLCKTVTKPYKSSSALSKVDHKTQVDQKQKSGQSSISEPRKLSRTYIHGRRFDDKKTSARNVCQSVKPVDKKGDCNKTVTTRKPACSKQDIKTSCSEPVIKPSCNKSEIKPTPSRQETVCSHSKPDIESTCRKPETKPVRSKLETGRTCRKPESKTLCEKSPDTFVHPSTECWDSDTSHASNKSNSEQDLGKDCCEIRQKSAVVETDRARLYGASKTDTVSDEKSESKNSAGELTCNYFVEKTDCLEVRKELKSGEGNTDTAAEQKFLSGIVVEKIRELRDQVSERKCTTSKVVEKAWLQSGKKSGFYDRGSKKTELVKEFAKLIVSDKGVARKTSVAKSVGKPQDLSKNKCFSSGCKSNTKKASTVGTAGSCESRGVQSIQRNSSTVEKGPFSGGTTTRSIFRGQGSRNVDKITEEDSCKSEIENRNDIGKENLKKDNGEKETSLKEEGSTKKKKKRSEKKKKKRHSSGQCSNTSGDIVRSRRESGNSWGSSNSGGLESQGHKNVLTSSSSRGSNPGQWNRLRNKSGNSLGNGYNSKNSCGRADFVNCGQLDFEPKGQGGSTAFEQNRRRHRSSGSWESGNSGKNICGKPSFVKRGHKEFGPEQNRPRNRGRNSWEGENSAFRKNLPPRFRKLRERKEFESSSEGHKQVEDHFSVRNLSLCTEEHREACSNSYSKKFDAGKVGRGRRVPDPEIKRLTDNLVEKLNLHGCVKTPGEDRKKTRSSNISVARPAPWRSEVPFVLEGSEDAWSEDSIPLAELKQKVLLPLSHDLSAAAPVALARSSPLRPASVESIPSVEDKAGVLHRTASWVKSHTDERYSYDIVASFEEAQLDSPFVKDTREIADYNQETYFEGEKMSGESELKMQAPVKKDSLVDENANIVDMKSLNRDKSPDSVCVVDCSDESSRSRWPSPASCEDFFSDRSGSQVSGSTTPSQRGRQDKRKVTPEKNKQNKMARGMVDRRRSPYDNRNAPPRHHFANHSSRGFNFRGPPPGMMGRNPYMVGGHHQSAYFQPPPPPNEVQPYSFGSFPSPSKPQDVGHHKRWYLDADISPTEFSPCRDMNSPAPYSPETLAQCRLPPPPPPGFGARNKSRGLDKRARSISPRLAGPGFLDRSRSPVSSSTGSVGLGRQNAPMAASHGSLCSVETDSVCVVDVRHVPSHFRQRTLEELVKDQEEAERKSRQTEKNQLGVFKMPDDEVIEQLKFRQRAYRGRGRGTAVQSASATSLMNRPGSGSFSTCTQGGRSKGAAVTALVASKSCDSISLSSMPKTSANEIKQEPGEAAQIQDDTVKGDNNKEKRGIERVEVSECASIAEKKTEGRFVECGKNVSHSPGGLSESYSSLSESKSEESVGRIAVCSQSGDNDESFGLAGEISDLNASLESESTDGQKFVVDDRGLFTESDPECSDLEARNGKPGTKSSYHHPQPFIRWRKTEASPLTPGSPYDTSTSWSRGADSPYSSYSPLPKGRGISPLTFDKHCQVRDKNKKQDDTTPVKVLRRGEAIPEDIKPTRGELGRLEEIKEEQGHSHLAMNRKTLFPKSEPGIEENSNGRVDGSPDVHVPQKLSLQMTNKLKQDVLQQKENLRAKLEVSEQKIAKSEKKEEISKPIDWFEERSPQRIQDDSFSNKEALMENARTRWSQTTSSPVYDPWLSQYDSQLESGAAAVKSSVAPSVFYPSLINAGMGPMLDTAEKRMSAPLPNLWSRFKKSEEQKEKAKDTKKFGWRRSTGSLPSTTTGELKKNSWSSSLGTKTYLYMPEPKSATNKASQMGSRTYSWGSLNDLSEEALSSLTDSPARSWKTKFRDKLDTSDIPYVDSHCHIDFLYKRVNYRGSWMKFQMMYGDTFMHNYYACVTNFCDPNSFRDNGMWRQILPEDGVYASFGCHPKSAMDYTDEKEEFLKHIIHHSKVVSLGEIGLDYSRGFDEHKECQKEVFVRQLKIAVQNKMPLVIHCREAEEDCLSLMMEHVPQDHLIHRHCFTGHWYELEPWLAYFSKCYVGLTPLVTFRSAECVHDVARRLPLERLLLETDAPYFRPPYVDKDDMNYSTPGMAICVAHEVAKLRGIAMDDVLLAARSNTLAMYGV